MADIIDGIKPTRMELLQLKKRVALAERGHRLLKEKRDALIAEFLKIANTVRSVRVEAEVDLTRAYGELLAAQAVMGRSAVRTISRVCGGECSVAITRRNVMGVQVPVIQTGPIARTVIERGYGFGDTSIRLDQAAGLMECALERIVKLAEIEETVDRISREVEKTKRRVNALEYIMLPRLHGTVKYIRMRLDEIEREGFARLKKIKAVLEERALQPEG